MDLEQMVGEMLLLMETSRCLRSAGRRARRAQAWCASPQPNAFSTQCLYSPAVPIRRPSAAVAPPLQDLNSAEVFAAGRGGRSRPSRGSPSALWESKELSGPRI